MNFYEELGLSSSASIEEIRQAHRRLARLLHPDKLQDKNLRHLAECQMKRLNSVYAVLSDAQQRLQYDLGLAAGKNESLPVVVSDDRTASRKRSAFLRQLRLNAIWILAALVCVVAMYAFLIRNSSGERMNSEQRAETQSNAAQPPKSSLPPSQSAKVEDSGAEAQPARQHEYESLARKASELQRSLRKAENERDTALAQVARLSKLPETTFTPSGRADISPVQPLTPLPDTTGDAATAAQLDEINPGPNAMQISGTWVFIPEPVDSSSREVYPPEYIEIVISEKDGYIQGRYRGRYQVADRAISPEVAFQFLEEINSSGRYPWIGLGGARGEVELKLLPDTSLQVAWFASELGQQMGLGSGTAVLTRRQKP